jgi:hypothetical protein
LSAWITADTRIRFDQRWCAEFLAQRGHHDAHRVREWVGVLIPHPFEELLGADDRAIGRHQYLEHPEFLLGQVDEVAAADDLTPRRVECQPAPGENRRQGGTRPASERAHARDQLGKRERLGQVIVGAQVQSLDPVVDGPRGGQHQDARGATGELSTQLITVDDRQVAIEHDDVILVGSGQFLTLAAVVGDIHGHAFSTQTLRDRVAQDPLVLDDQDAHCLPKREYAAKLRMT